MPLRAMSRLTKKKFDQLSVSFRDEQWQIKQDHIRLAFDRMYELFSQFIWTRLRLKIAPHFLPSFAANETGFPCKFGFPLYNWLPALIVIIQSISHSFCSEVRHEEAQIICIVSFNSIKLPLFCQETQDLCFYRLFYWDLESVRFSFPDCFSVGGAKRDVLPSRCQSQALYCINICLQHKFVNFL